MDQGGGWFVWGQAENRKAWFSYPLAYLGIGLPRYQTLCGSVPLCSNQSSSATATNNLYSYIETCHLKQEVKNRIFITDIGQDHY